MENLKTFRAAFLFRKDRGDELLIRRDVKYFKAVSLLEALRQAKAYGASASRNKRWKVESCVEVE